MFYAIFWMALLIFFSECQSINLKYLQNLPECQSNVLKKQLKIEKKTLNVCGNFNNFMLTGRFYRVFYQND